MTLTISYGPLASHARDTRNYSIDGPAHKVLFDEFPRRVRAMFGGAVVLDTVRGMLLHESNILPVLYVPFEDVAKDVLVPSDLSTYCPFKGEASYWSVAVGDRVAQDALWTYPAPVDSAPWLRGYVAAYWDRMDAWFDEDEEVFTHLRDPYHRVDVFRTSRHVEVIAHGERIADSRRAVLLSETGLTNRFYLPFDDVRADVLELSSTHTHCPYKGFASYRSVRTPGGFIPDAGWFYPEVLDGVTPIKNRICLVADGIETRIDGVPLVKAPHARM